MRVTEIDSEKMERIMSVKLALQLLNIVLFIFGIVWWSFGGRLVVVRWWFLMFGG